MSNSHHLGHSSLEEIEHFSYLSQRIGSLLCNEDYSDVILLVEGQRIPCHKVILASMSEYFRALLFGGLKESQKSEVELKETKLPAFKILLKYIYTGHITVASLEVEVVLDTLCLAHQYCFVELVIAISDFLKAILNNQNVCQIYDMACLFQFPNLIEECLNYVDYNASDIIHHESFLRLSPSSLKKIIKRDSFCAPEIDIFQTVCQWASQNPDINPSEIVSSVRLSILSLPEILNLVRPTGLVDRDTILDVIKTKIESQDCHLNYRGYLAPEENVASVKHGAQVLHGLLCETLLNNDVHAFDTDSDCPMHPIDDNNGQGILIKLGRRCVINHMKMLLWDNDMRSYSYYVEVSINQKDWVKVVDYKKYLCRSWQQLYFRPLVARYIRIVGTHNTVNRMFHIVSFKSMFTSTSFKLEKDLLYPANNVATKVSHACVIEGESSDSNDVIINGDTQNYNGTHGYTYHGIDEGGIVLQLAQPYILGSMRLLLWDRDGRSYNYFIEVSTDNQNWNTVIDKRKELCKSWQLLTFPPRPVVFIKIVGTHNTENEFFHCVHFECPAQVPDPVAT